MNDKYRIKIILDPDGPLLEEFVVDRDSHGRPTEMMVHPSNYENVINALHELHPNVEINRVVDL